MTQRRVVIIGAGHHGLTAAALLAKAGKDVIVLEQRSDVGGATVTESLFPDTRVDMGAHNLSQVPESLVTELGLSGHGLTLRTVDPGVLAGQPGGDGLQFFPDLARTRESVEVFSPRDAQRLDAFCRLLHKATTLLEAAYRVAPPDPVTGGAKDLLTLAQLGGKLKRLGKRDMTEVMRILPMTAQELLDEWFETDLLKGALAATGVIGVFQGPMSSGTAYTVLHHHVNAPFGSLRPLTIAKGGVQGFVNALAAAAVAYGAQVRTDHAVDRVLVGDDGAAEGVSLVNGETVHADAVISCASPRHTFTELVPPGLLGPSLNRAVGNIRYRGAVSRVHLLLDAPPELPGDASPMRALTIGPSIEYLERAYDAAKHGGVSERPHVEATVVSAGGKWVLSANIQFTPYQLSGGWDAAASDTVLSNTVATLDQCMPGLADRISDQSIMTPVDIEERFGLPEGNMYGGEMALDQLLFMRPVPQSARYQTPLRGLYVCGAGTHPGGGVHGYAGMNAAKAVLNDF